MGLLDSILALAVGWSSQPSSAAGAGAAGDVRPQWPDHGGTGPPVRFTVRITGAVSSVLIAVSGATRRVR